jgi:peptidoglycan/xylan/chitin deacetylase (PgdA/CDA1 family)
VRPHTICAVVGLLAGGAPAFAREPIVTRIENPERRIAITFDACATKTHGYGFDRPVYRILQREHIPSTIFVAGRWVEFHPQIMTELAADPLVEFGNHSYDHPHMSRLGNHDMELEIDETEAALGRYGKHGVAFRPPFGDFNARMLDVVRDRGLPVVSWDVVSGDPSAATTREGMIREVERRTRPGSIVIFHINGRGHKTAEALPAILRELKARGFAFVHLSELLASGAPGGLPGMSVGAGGAGGGPVGCRVGGVGGAGGAGAPCR